MKYIVKLSCMVFLLLSLGSSKLAAQTAEGNWTLSGTVVDGSKQTLPGVSILLKGSKLSTTTDNNGRFKISVPATSGTLVFTYVGAKKQEVMFNNPRTFSITLEDDSKLLDEIIVVGYGTQKKENLTGAVDQVKADDLAQRPVVNLAQSLQGMLPNLNLTPGDGKPTQSPSFNIRGATSIGQGGNALVLIDGVEGNPQLLNPHDIETVTILKDAASAAIYGARGVFGVVLITTKTPAKEKVQVTYSSNFALKEPTTTPEFVTDGYQWASMFNEAFSSWNNYGSTPQNVFAPRLGYQSCLPTP